LVCSLDKEYERVVVKQQSWLVLFLVGVGGLAIFAERGASAPPHGLRVPPGFEVAEFADNSLANDIFCLTLDPQGRPVVSGRGYLRVLVDDDGDGRADRALDFAGPPADGAMGLLWEGNTLYCMGGGGLRRYRDANGTGRTRPSELLHPFKTGGEHDAHALARGPDGWLYVLCGNSTGIGRRHATLPTSPIQDPVAGCVLRFAPDLKGCEIIADGFRNAYGMDFNSDGELFTFDSDNERCVSLPWYEPTRCYHLVPGGHYGWLAPQIAATWRLPPYFPDVVAPLTTLGRGSPTGVVCYRHTQFPPEYQGALFLLDWTFGRIWAVKLQRCGSSYTGRPELFLESVGDNGFAPTAAAVHPVTGDLYVSIGGRGTRGAIYRIRYPAGLPAVRAADVATRQPRRRSLDWQAGSEADVVARTAGSDLHQRLRALHEMRRHRAHFSADQVSRAVASNAGSTDRGLRQAAADLFATLEPGDQDSLVRALIGPREAVTLALARPDTGIARLAADKTLTLEVRLEAVRAVQRALGGLTAVRARGTVWEGYSCRREGASLPAPARAALRDAFPSGEANLDRELARTLAIIEDDDPGVLARTTDRLTADSSPIEDIHYLIVLARLSAPRSFQDTRRTAEALIALDHKLAQRRLNRDRNWPLRIAEMHAELAHKDPALNAALLAHPEFGRPDHVLFTRCPGFDRRRAAEILLKRSKKDPEFAWNAQAVQLLGALPDEKVRPVLRRLWGEHGLDDALLPLLARHPQAKDRERFRAALNSPQAATVLLALEALDRLPARPADADEVLALLLALRRLPEGKEVDPVRRRLDEALQKATGQKLSGAEAWTGWARGRYQERAARLADADGVDAAAWERRLAAVRWQAGDADRGRLVFTRASCAACHSGAQALGPDLRGVAGRFSRADLFTAIVRPSKDVSPRYRTTQIVTEAGKVYQGLVIYEAVDSLLLQTGPATTVRLTNPQVRERRPTAVSLMPAGLIDALSDRDLADLYAYLKGLSGPGQPGR
jgi:putative membrane-bound dehydrogenase-like protein